MTSYTVNVPTAQGGSPLAGAFTAGRPTGPGFLGYETLTGSTPSARINSMPTGDQATFLDGTVQFSDFADANGTMGIYCGLNVYGLRGSDTAGTVLQMAPNTSTQAAKVPAQTTGQTNPLYLLRIGGNSTTQRAPIVSDLTLQGTPQGHLYNGLYFYHATGGLVARVRIAGIPGHASIQPDETFGGNDYDGVGNTWDTVEFDGHAQDGTLVGASGFGGNGSKQLTLLNCYSHHNIYSAGFTVNNCQDVTYRKCRATDNGKMGFNFERVSGTVILDQCATARNGTYDIAIASDTTSAVYQITDPQLAPGQVLKVHVTGFNGNPRAQNPNSISCTVAGVSHPELMQLIIEN